MADKSDSVFNENKSNKNMSSPAESNKFYNSNKIHKETPSSPENSTFLTDAFVANLLSEQDSPKKTDNSESCNNEKNLNNSLKDKSTLYFELKDNGTNSIDTPDLIGSSFTECLEKNDSGINIKEDTSTNNQDTSTSSEGSSDLIMSSPTESDEKVDTGTKVQEENNQVENINQEKKKELPSSDSLTEEAVKMHNEINKPSYREEDSWTDDDSSSTFSLNSSSDCSDSFLHKMQREVNTAQSNKVNTLKTRGELDIDELPPIQDLQINVNESDVEKIGFVHAIVDKLVIVRALKNLQALDIDSVLFLTSQKPLGRIFDVFGPVSEPFYTVRFNSLKHIVDTGVEVENEVFYAPQKKEITIYVFVDELKKQKGSDASWKDNNEPPEEFIDYSDDEQEKVAKQKRRAKNRPKPFEDEPKLPKRDQLTVQFRPPQPYVSQQQNLTRPEVEFRRPEVEFRRPEVEFRRPEVQFRRPEIFMSQPQQNLIQKYQSSEVQFRRPETFVSQPQQNLLQKYQSPEVQFRRPETFVPQPQQNLMHSYQPPKFQFRQPQPFSSQPQHNLASGPQAPFGYQSPPPQSTYQFHQSSVSQPARYPTVYVQQQASQPNPVAFQQPHVFGQMTPMGPMSPALQQPPVHFAPPVMSPTPLVSMAPASPNFSYFSHKYVSAPSPPAHGHIPPNSPWFQGQAANGPPRVRYLTPLSPLSIQIPNTLRTPPPTMQGTAANSFNAVSPIQRPQNMGPYMHQPGTHPY